MSQNYVTLIVFVAIGLQICEHAMGWIIVMRVRRRIIKIVQTFKNFFFKLKPSLFTAFQEYRFDANQWLQLSNIGSWNTLIFSIRTQKEARFLVCFTLNQTSRFCYGVFIGTHSNTKSSINQCDDVSLRSCRLLKIEQTENILSAKEWRTFILKLSESPGEIQIYSNDRLVMSTPMQEEINQNYLLLKAKLATDGLLRLHKCNQLEYSYK
ncbi:uncharacterized protein LOC107265949, partial [Cephus cinctus]|uniref:Uncharacterized protein LOC107265949 n=1 Tax=Cephus cinctus TaxID=211228 RepID=A0AAJ7VZJ1_CEPCN